MALFELFGVSGGAEADEMENGVSEFLAALPLVRSEAARQERRMTDASHTEITQHMEGPKGKRLLEARSAVCSSSSSGGAPALVPAWSCDAKWPVKLRRTERGGQMQRQGAEDEKRRLVVKRAADIVQEAGLSLAALAVDSPDPEAVLSRVGQGRRYRTIQKRVASWLRAREWFLASLGSPWPSSTSQVLSYLEARVEEPCPALSFGPCSLLFRF